MNTLCISTGSFGCTRML